MEAGEAIARIQNRHCKYLSLKGTRKTGLRLKGTSRKMSEENPALETGDLSSRVRRERRRWYQTKRRRGVGGRRKERSRRSVSSRQRGSEEFHFLIRIQAVYTAITSAHLGSSRSPAGQKAIRSDKVCLWHGKQCIVQTMHTRRSEAVATSRLSLRCHPSQKRRSPLRRQGLA